MLSIKRIFLDTNIFIVGSPNLETDEAKILDVIGYRGGLITLKSEIILSDELIDQIRRVGKYLWGKDEVSLVLSRLWSNLNWCYVSPNSSWFIDLKQIKKEDKIPSEDINIYLSAKYGKADCFVSSNRKLIASIADFECLTPNAFVNKYLD